MQMRYMCLNHYLHILVSSEQHFSIQCTVYVCVSFTSDMMLTSDDLMSLTTCKNGVCTSICACVCGGGSEGAEWLQVVNKVLDKEGWAIVEQSSRSGNRLKCKTFQLRRYLLVTVLH